MKYTSHKPAAVSGQAFCDDTQDVTPGVAFTALQTFLADVIGSPSDCEHQVDQGDLLQDTTTGLAFYEASSGTPNFTNGAEHWAVVESDLQYWTDAAAEPAPAQPQAHAPTPPPAAAVTSPCRVRSSR